MRLFDFFKTITTKFMNRDIQRLPEAGYINSANVENSIIHENAYINAYTRQIKTRPSNIIKVEENGKILKMKQNDTKLKLSGIKRLKESLPVEDGRQIDLYRGILEKNEKKNLVYFGLENGVNLKKALEDKNRSYKVSNKMTKMFTIPVNNQTSKFLGSLVEDDIYKNYCITKSNRLENYVNQIEERRIKLLQEKKQQSQIKNQNQKKVVVAGKLNTNNKVTKNINIAKNSKISANTKRTTNNNQISNNSKVVTENKIKTRKTVKV